MVVAQEANTSTKQAQKGTLQMCRGYPGDCVLLCGVKLE